ncbi:MAG: hypothetical protein CMF23_01595 [Ignavibacteriae bacterium]|nr:hypothetical protein [Ignavibacteriota bacterium]
MKNRLIQQSERDTPLYKADFNSYWETTYSQLTKNSKFNTYSNSILFKNWKLAINSLGTKKFDTLFGELHEDTNASLYLAMFGLYRTAYMHLRSLIELSIQLIFFYQHEVEYEQWEEGNYIMKFEQLSSYLQKHPKLKGKVIDNILSELYKNWKTYSKHIHAEKPLFFQCTKDSKLTNTFCKADFNRWEKQYNGTIKLLNKIYILFFSDYLNRFPNVNREIILTNLTKKDQTDLGLS